MFCGLIRPKTPFRSKLRRHIYDLRKALPDNLAEQPWLLQANNCIQWNPASPFSLDVAQFLALSKNSASQAQAVALYSDDLLLDLYSDWLMAPA